MTSTRGRPQGLAALVDDAAGEVARRAVGRSVAWWRTRTARGRTRADATRALVATLAAYGQAVELGADPATSRTPPAPRREDVLVDQLAVVAYDLVRALRAADPDAPVPRDGTVARTAVRAAAECLLTASEVDPGRPLPGGLLDALSAADVGAFGDAIGRLPRAGDG